MDSSIQLKQHIKSMIEDLPGSMLTEVAHFVEFLKIKAGKKAYQEGVIASLSSSSEAHLLEEFAKFDQIPDRE